MLSRGKTLFSPLRHGFFALMLLLLMLPGGAFGAPGDNAPEPAPASTDDSFIRIWGARAGDLAALAKEAETLRNNAELMADPQALQEARARISRLSGLFQASRGHPTEQISLVRQMRGLQEKLKNTLKPLEDIAATINIRLDEIAALQKDMDDLARERAADGADAQSGNAAETAEWKKYTRTLADAKAKLTNASARLEKIMAPAKAANTRVNQTLTAIESSLVETWRAYYLTPSSNDLDALTSLPSLLADWLSSLNSRMRFAYPQSLDEWFQAARNFVVAAVIMALLGFLGMRGTRVLSKRWHEACMDVFKGAWVWIGVGASILATAANQYGGIYFAFVLLGALPLIAGIAALSWRLRMAVKPVLQNKPSPLNRLFPAAAIGVLMLFSDLPSRILGIMWGLVICVFLVRIYYINRNNVADRSLPFLERFSYGCAFWFGLASLLVALSGHARLAILLFMLLFALVNTLTLSSALMALFENLANRQFSKEAYPVRNAIAEAAAIPAAWALSLLCTLPWLWAVPGADYLIRYAMAANYTLGAARFDFSKMLVIILLFFLFRSFISLSSTSLAQLPKHMPHIERGVIPPLRTMIRYGLWSVFGLVSLGILGVDFTSLAVVAGGLSVGIGFGMQNLFNNLISGLILIFGRTILVGDYVDVAGASGTVRAINIRSTTIETPDRALVYVPNSAIMAGQFSNWTRSSRMVRRNITVGVAYGSDTALVTKLLLEIAQRQEHVLKKPEPGVLFSNFGAHSLDFTLNVFLDDVNNGGDTLSAIRFDIEKSFKDNGIDIPFPQLTLHMPEAPGERGLEGIMKS